jgi:hypothetical protein
MRTSGQLNWSAKKNILQFCLRVFGSMCFYGSVCNLGVGFPLCTINIEQFRPGLSIPQHMLAPWPCRRRFVVTHNHGANMGETKNP